jgi:flotillin
MGIVILLMFLLIFIMMRYMKRCPKGKLLVVYGRVKPDPSGAMRPKLYNGGAVFVMPILQDFAYLDLAPIPVELELRGALSRENTRINVKARIMIAISENLEEAQPATTRLLGLEQQQVYEIAKEIMVGQFRLVIASDPATEILNNPHVFLDNIKVTCASELRKIGMVVMDVQILDIKS